MSLLFEPITIRSVTARNRIVVSPMCQYSATDGFVNDWHIVHLGSRAIGGAGIVFTEATAVSPEGRISPGDLGIWNDRQLPGLQQLTGVIKQHGAVAGIQLAHAGRKASHSSPWQGNVQLTGANGGWQTLAPSAVAFREDQLPPVAMTGAQIRQVIADFSRAAQRAYQAGFQVIEIHAAHGYLLNEFLSPLSNFRDDEYGGSFENRIKMLLETVQEVRRVIPEDMPLFVRISATEWTPGGWDEADSVKLANCLKPLGVDLIDCSSGGNSSSQQIPAAALYQVPFAESIRKKAAIATGAVGLITEAREAEDILKNGQADLVFLGRQLLRDPYFPLRAAKELGAGITWPVQYERAQ